MSILVTGATGTVGAEVVRELTEQGREVRALTRSPEKASFPAGVTAVGGELTDVAAMTAALDGVDGLFLLSPVALEELTGSLLTLDLAQAAGVRDVVYLSVIHADRFTDPPHFAGKAGVERMLTERGIAATILRPGYYMQNDAAQREQILGGVYAPPLGERGVLLADARDIGAAAAQALLERAAATDPLPTETIDVVDPETYTGTGIAALWAAATGRPVSYGGGDLDTFERAMSAGAPGWMARDMRLMFQRFQQDGMVAAPGTDERLRALLGRPVRSYRDFVTETVASWG